MQKENAPVPPNAIMVNFATIVFAVAFGHDGDSSTYLDRTSFDFAKHKDPISSITKKHPLYLQQFCI